MNEKLTEIKNKIKTFHEGLNRDKKIALYIGLALIVVAIIFAGTFFTRTEYVVIAQGLTPLEAQAVTMKLDEANISWEDSMGSSVITVPKGDASRARMLVASEMNSTHFSWANVFESENITTTSQTREQKYIQALAGEIQMSLQTLEAVNQARVTLNIPKESNYFVTDDIKPSAAVVLSLTRGTQLTEAQVNGIVNLVSSAVKDLKPENITIIDTNGIQLNSAESGHGGFSTNSQFDLQYKIQSQLQSDLTKFLQEIFGPGNVIVQPRIILDFNQEQESQRLFSPPIAGETEGMVRSSSSINERVVNAPGAQGAPGTDTNTGEPTQFVEGTDGGSTYEKASETLNRELNEIHRQIVRSQGDVKELSIGVIINSNALVDGQMTAEDRAEIISLISHSAGTQAENITVVVREFSDPTALYDVYFSDAEERLILGIPVFALVIIILITLAAVVIVIFLMKKKKDAQLAEQEAEALRLEELEKQKREKANAIEMAEDTGSPKYHIEKFVDANPEAAATLLRNWLNE